ncbi:D111/G-patch domain-containing protein [Rhynchospora pubera]|uniref:D111/G-patch domain-containing protein n=1 Tax=Rhynchospora pubera TaxID=906938 RepID=A0AAV8ESX5_9POAL|nr:D111/G-patch domain-containing protein [Rhynchospora pubera]
MEGDYANSQLKQSREGDMEAEVGCNRRAIDSSNIGFQLLKKCGWKEGTGLGASEQGRLEPIETRAKNNKRGLGADGKNKKPKVQKDPPNSEVNAPKKLTKKVKLATKRLKKLQEEEKRLQEKEFEREFFRMFWPDNV